MLVLVSNVGSTSLKFKLYDMPKEDVLCEAKIENVGSCNGKFHYRNLNNERVVNEDGCQIDDYSSGIKMFISSLTDKEDGVIDRMDRIEAIGFKTVIAKGFNGVYELTDEVIGAMKDYMVVAPAHNGPYVSAIEQFKLLLPDAKYVGVFETAFHKTIPSDKYTYSIPYEWYEKYGIKRMGFHGASHSYISQTLEEELGNTGRSISCHLGGSCSLCAIDEGKSIDSSFGFSPQAGVLHANRSGDIDPYIIFFLLDMGLSVSEIRTELEKHGGLYGISGISNDLRTILEEKEKGNDRAQLAIDTFVTSIIRYIGSFYLELGGLDNLVFTGGIGENSQEIRKLVCDKLKTIGVEIDDVKNNMPNKDKVNVISSADSKVNVYVIPANEELGVCRKTYQCINE